MNARDYLRDAYEKGIPIKDIAEKLGISTDAVKSRAQRDKDCPKHGSFFVRDKMGMEAHSQGELKMRDASKKEQSRIERLLEQNGYRPRWSVSWVHLYDGDTKTTTLLRNPEEAEQEEKWQEEFLARIQKQAPQYKVQKKKVTDGHLHLIDIADLHIGKLALDNDNNRLYNIEQAVASADGAVESLVTRGQGYNIEEFLLPIGNDVLHVDGKGNTTTSGTPQMVAGHWTEMVDAAFDLYVRLAENLASVAPVRLIHCRDNHAEHLSYMLARMVEAQLSNHKWVTTHISHQDRSYYQYGQVMIGMDHGHGAKLRDLPQIAAAEAPKMWGDTNKRYFYRHHLHHASRTEHQVLKDLPGLTVQYMRAPCPPDDWHHDQGYIGVPKAVDSFVIHPQMGQVAHLTCPVGK